MPSECERCGESSPTCACCGLCWDCSLTEDPTPSDGGMDFELGAACDLGDTDCESCQ